jgi:hypothetical protein
MEATDTVAPIDERWFAIATVFVLRLALTLFHWLLTGREAAVSRVHIDFDYH